MNYESHVMGGVFYLQLEEKEIEYLTYPEADFIWSEKLPLEEGDGFLLYATQELGPELMLEYFLHHNEYALSVIYNQWRISIGLAEEGTLTDQVEMLREVVSKLVELHAQELHDLRVEEELLS